MKNKLLISMVTSLLFSLNTFAGVPGIYTIISNTPMGEIESTIVLNTDGTGSIKDSMVDSEFSGAKITEKKFNFDVTAELMMGDIDMNYSGVVENNSISGIVTNNMGQFEFSGTRKE